MYPFVESLALVDGLFRNLEYHDARVARTQQHFYGTYLLPPFREILSVPADYRGGRWKCRVEYGLGVGAISYIPYAPRIVRRLYLVEAPEIEYSFKYSDRTSLAACYETFFSAAGVGDNEADILIVQNGMLTDSSAANVVLQMHDGLFYTPNTPLLHGTMRAFLLDTGQILERRLTVRDIRGAQGVILINAMLPLDLNRMVRKII